MTAITTNGIWTGLEVVPSDGGEQKHAATPDVRPRITAGTRSIRSRGREDPIPASVPRRRPNGSCRRRIRDRHRRGRPFSPRHRIEGSAGPPLGGAAPRGAARPLRGSPFTDPGAFPSPALPSSHQQSATAFIEGVFISSMTTDLGPAGACLSHRPLVQALPRPRSGP
jgi:hypothetical protein